MAAGIRPIIASRRAAEVDELREGVRARLVPDIDGRVTHVRWADAMKGRRVPEVESRKGAVSHVRSVSPPRSSNRTCRFPASGFPTGFTSQLSAVAPGERDAAEARHIHRKQPHH
jgi:hypothetical protein